MTMFLAPYTAIADIDGSPLDAGFLFFGEYGKDPELFPVEAFWDADFTVPAAQPIRTRNGYPVRNGSPTKVYLKTAQHSIVIKNRNSAFILVDFNNKGWSADFVVDGNESQHQINRSTIRTVESIADLIAIKNPKEGQVVFVKSFYAGLGIGGQDFIKNNSTEKYNVGGFCVATDDTLTASQIGLTKSRNDNATLLSNYLPLHKKIKLDNIYDVSNSINMKSHYTTVDGLQKDFGFNWVGGNGESTARNKRKVVCDLNSLNLANNTSTSEVYLSDFTVNLKSAKNVIGVDARYFTQQSKLHNLNIVEVGQESIGIYVNKAWYSSIDDCTVSGWSESTGGVRQGIGVYLDTKLYAEDTPDEWNQINAFKTKVRCHTLDIGYLIDSSSGICGASIADYPTIENCNVGIKMTNGGTINNPDTFYIQAYLENNTIDVEWGDPSETTNNGGVVVWQNCFFSAMHSNINLWQGVHYFIGCSGLRNLTVGDGAECMLLGTPLPVGDMSAKVVVLSMPSWNQSANSYASVNLKPESGMSKRILSAADNVTYNLSEFTRELKKPYGGASFVVRVIVSDSEGVNIKSHSEIVCKLNASGDQYSFAVVSGSGLSVSATGVLTIASSDYSTVDIMLSSM